MPGQVYCFNCYNEAINPLSVNGQSAGGIPGWQSSGATIYTPASARVARARHGDGQSSPVFASDMPNQLSVSWDSYRVQASLDLTRLPNISLDDDLILQIAVNQLTLLTTRGFVLMSVPVSPQSAWD